MSPEEEGLTFTRPLAGHRETYLDLAWWWVEGEA